MGYVHVIIDMKVNFSARGERYIQRDRSRDEALEYVLIPYVKNAKRILVEGVFISAFDIEKIAVFESLDESKTLFDQAFTEGAARFDEMASQGGEGAFDTLTMHGAIRSQASDITLDILREAASKRQ